MTRRCSECGISYPMAVTVCMVTTCGEKTDPMNNSAPDADWREKVDMANTPAPSFEDGVPRWRFNQLMKAGFSPREAEYLASKSHGEVDLHKATDLARRAGPALAFEILT